MHYFYNKIIGTLRKTKIKTRIFVALLLISIIPTLLVGYICFQNSSSAIRSKISTYSVQVLNETSQNIHSKVEELNNFGDELCYSNTIQNCLQQYVKDGKKQLISKSRHDYRLEQLYFFQNITACRYLRYRDSWRGSDAAVWHGVPYAFRKQCAEIRSTGRKRQGLLPGRMTA